MQLAGQGFPLCVEEIVSRHLLCAQVYALGLEQ